MERNKILDITMERNTPKQPANKKILKRNVLGKYVIEELVNLCPEKEWSRPLRRLYYICKLKIFNRSLTSPIFLGK